MTTCKIAVGTQVMVHTRVIYRQYELPASSVGIVVTVDDLGDCRVDWKTIGMKWLLRPSFQSISIRDAKGNWIAFDPHSSDGDDEDELGSVQDERASPFSWSKNLRSERHSREESQSLLRSLPDPVMNIAGSFDAIRTAPLEPPAEPTMIKLVVPEDVSVEGDYPLGLILDNVTGDICVTEVEPDSWGARTGVVPGDILVELNGQALKSASQEEVKQLGRLRPLPITVLRPALEAVSPIPWDSSAELLAQTRNCELHADAAERSLADAQQTPLSSRDLADLFAAHRARAEDAERRAIQSELRADFLVAKSEGRSELRTSNDALVVEGTAFADKTIVIGFPDLPRAPSGVPDTAEEVALPVPDLVTDRNPEPCCRCSTHALSP